MKKETTILVPVDFSPAAINAVEYAIALAKKIDATLLLLHVYYIPGVSARVQYFADEESLAEQYRVAKESLLELKDEIPLLETVKYDIKAVAAYWPIELPEVIEEEKADIIIMGTKGARGLKEFTIGTTTATVVDKVQSPVIIIPANAKFTGIQSIGLAVDGHPVENLDILAPLLLMKEKLNAAIEVFYYKESAKNAENMSALQRYLNSTTVIHGDDESESIEKEINRYREERHIDLIVLLARKKGLLESFFKDSMEKKMAYHSTAPLFIIHDHPNKG